MSPTSAVDARPTSRPPVSGRTSFNEASGCVAVPVVSPKAATVSSRAGSCTGTAISTASVSLPSFTLIWMRVAPADTVRASKRTASLAPAASVTVCVAVEKPSAGRAGAAPAGARSP